MARSASQTYKVAMISLTCSYYQVALFKDLSANADIDLMVYFCSEEAIPSKDLSRMFNTDAIWEAEDDLLEGYPYKFLKNYSPWPSYLKAYLGLMNFGIWEEIANSRPDLVVLMGWNNPTWWIGVLACLRYKIPFCYMSDTNIHGEVNRSKISKWLKKAFLGHLQFPLASGFLCSGSANARFYEYFGIPEEKLIPFAYSWGYRQFLATADSYLQDKAQLRQEFGIVDTDRVILFCGRFVREKNLHNLIQAYSLIETGRSKLILVGDGELSGELKDLSASKNIKSIEFHGFQNRKAISKYYAMSDYLILASSRETWGLVVNEAMCFSLPILTSSQVGSAEDLVSNEVNGFVFPYHDIDALAGVLSKAITLPENERLSMGRNSREMIECWSNRNLAEPLLEFLDKRLSR